MAVRMAGVEMIDRDPIEPGSEVLLHLKHDVAGEAAQIGQLVVIIGRDDKAELMAIVPPPLHKRPPVSDVRRRSIEPSALPFPVPPIALQIAQVGVGCFAAASQLAAPRFDRHTALQAGFEDRYPNSWRANVQLVRLVTTSADYGMQQGIGHLPTLGPKTVIISLSTRPTAKRLAAFILPS